MTAGDGVVDLEVMACLLRWLKHRAEVVGDKRMVWAFGQWYAWVWASIRGEEYYWPDMPQALAVWS